MKESRMAGGRIAVYVPDHPKANNRGYVLRARHRMEQQLGRYLREDEEVHHKNENKTDDRSQNLEVKLTPDHARHHHPFGPTGRRLDYKRIEKLVKQGLGYKRIAKLLDEPIYSVKYAVRVIRGR